MKTRTKIAIGVALGLTTVSSQATIMSVSGPASSAGALAFPEIIVAPNNVLDDVVTNRLMQGFDEAQNVTTGSAYNIDGGILPVGSYVSSHMIFLNSGGGTRISHSSVVWTFDEEIVGVMSDSRGTFEAASSGELGNPATNYTVTGMGTGPAAPFRARGLESNNGDGLGPGDGYEIIAANQIRVSMRVTEPGDWIRVVTKGSSVPDGGQTLMLLGLVLAGFGAARRHMK